MNEEIKAAVEEAIAPLKQDIEALKAQLAPLVAMVPKPKKLPASIKEAQEVLKGLPKETFDALKVVNVQFDAKAPWFALVRADGTIISVKKTATDFRVRHRDQTGALLKELTPSFNGLATALKSLA